MKLDKFQKAKVVLGLSLFVLLFAILFIPHAIDNGLSWASEDTLETLFLALSFLATIYVFWHYDYLVQKRGQESLNLSSKLQNKEKELLEAFQYLGKINVRFSVIRDLLDGMKDPIPTTREELNKALKKLLDIACSATSKDRALLKIVNVKSNKILIEEKSSRGFDNGDGKSQTSAKNLLEIYNKKRSSKTEKLEVFYSDLDNFNIKTFLILPSSDDSVVQGEDFLKALINQSEILFLLLDSQYYRSKKNHNGKK
ncbi:MAG: hypothetical protein KAQ63_01640 [Candidatus Moranbacteria bacterium]|nr:hypothetical protein [Candidatus Moranbacteria bacterium]